MSEENLVTGSNRGHYTIYLRSNLKNYGFNSLKPYS